MLGLLFGGGVLKPETDISVCTFPGPLPEDFDFVAGVDVNVGVDVDVDVEVDVVIAGNIASHVTTLLSS